MNITAGNQFEYFFLFVEGINSCVCFPLEGGQVCMDFDYYKTKEDTLPVWSCMVGVTKKWAYLAKISVDEACKITPDYNQLKLVSCSHTYKLLNKYNYGCRLVRYKHTTIVIL